MATKESTAIMQSHAMNTLVEIYSRLSAELGVEKSPFVTYVGHHEHRKAIMMNDLANGLSELVEALLAKQVESTVVLDVKLEK